MADAVDSISGLSARYRADSITGIANGASINLWSDTSGNAYVGSVVNAPTFTANSINGQPAVTFNAAASQYLTSPAPAGGVYQTIFAVVKPSMNGALRTIRGGISNGLQFRINTANYIQFVKQGTADIAASSIGVTASIPYLLMGMYDSTTGAYNFYINGADVGSGVSQYALSTSVTGVGAQASGNEFFAGDIAELVTYSKVLSATERTTILDYVQRRYNIASNIIRLPALETWAAANNSSWPVQWVSIVTSGVGGGTDIQGNSGRITAGTVASASIRQHLLQMVPTTDTDVVVSFTFASQIEGYVNVLIRSDTGLLTSNNFFPKNGYIMQIGCAATAANGGISISKSLGNATSSLASTSTTIISGTSYSIRFQCVGTTLRWKIWAASATEPIAWLGTATDSGTQPAAGTVALGASNGASSTTVYVTFNNFMLTSSSAALGYFDPFTGPTGVGWPGAWLSGAIAGKAIISSNVGLMTVNNSYTRRDLTMTAVDNADVMLTVIDNTSSSVENYFLIGTNADSQDQGSGTSPNGYYLRLAFNGTAASSSIQIMKGTTVLSNIVTMTLSTGTAYVARFQKFGQILRGKVWAANGSEPTAWSVTYTTGDATSTGYVSLSCQTTATSDITFSVDNVSVTSAYSQVKMFDGTLTNSKALKVWNGTAWVAKPIKQWNGTAWASQGN